MRSAIAALAGALGTVAAHVTHAHSENGKAHAGFRKFHRGLLTTPLPPTSGDAHIGGFSIRKDPNEIRKIIGYVPQMLAADGALTGYENLMLFAKLYGIPWSQCRNRVYDALEFMGLKEEAGKKVKEYSGGMIRKLEIDQSMMHRPRRIIWTS